MPQKAHPRFVAGKPLRGEQVVQILGPMIASEGLEGTRSRPSQILAERLQAPEKSGENCRHEAT